MHSEVTRIARIYVIAISMLVFTGVWWAVGRTPLPGKDSPTAPAAAVSDPRLQQLEARRRRLEARARRVRQRNAAALRRYRRQRTARLQLIAQINRQNAAPSFRAPAPAAGAPAVPSVSVSVPTASTPPPTTSTGSS
jgi:hypothetical protein